MAMANQMLLSGGSLILPTEGRSCCRVAHELHAPLRGERWRNVLSSCRASSAGRDMYKVVAKTLHRRPRNMKGLKLTNQEILQELEAEEVEDEFQQGLNTGDKSVADQGEVISERLLEDGNGKAVESKEMKIKLEQIGIKQS